jgi:YVTN family beta-propeller protein
MGLNRVLITNLKTFVSRTVIITLVLVAFLPIVLAAPSSAPRTSSNIVTTVVVGPEPNEIVYNPSSNKVYVSHAGTGYGSTGNVSVIDASTNRVVAMIRLDSNPGPLLYNPFNHRVYVTSANGVNVIDETSNKVLTTISLSNVGALAYNPSNHNVYVSGWQTIWIIDSSTNKITGQFNGVSGFNLAFDSNKSYLYASDDYANTLLVINTLSGKLIRSVQMCQWCDPSGMAFNPGNGRIYLANFGIGKVSVISDTTNNIVATITVGNNPFGALYDPLNQKVYISDYSSAILSKIDPQTNTVVANLSAGSGPWNIALDTVNGLLYITNLGSNTVTVISP